MTHSLKAPGFNPSAYEVKKSVSKFACKFNLYRYASLSSTEKERRGLTPQPRRVGRGPQPRERHWERDEREQRQRRRETNGGGGGGRGGVLSRARYATRDMYQTQLRVHN